jgi:hypothetical protein
MKFSASSISNFKDCCMRFRNHDLWRIRKVEDTESQRRGNIWHKLQQLISLKSGEKCPECKGTGGISGVSDFGMDDIITISQCQICNGTGKIGENVLDIITNYINEQYSELPENRTYEDWMVERTVILNAFAGYLWYYQKHYTVLVSEYEFEIELFPGVIFHGKIDQIVRDEFGQLYVREFKTTSKSLDDQTYWSHLTLDVQTSLYLMVAQYLQSRGLLVEFGITPDEPLISKVLYNVWHKPQIAPTWLTQKDSKTLIETGEYFGQKFNVNWLSPDGDPGDLGSYSVNEIPLQLKPGAKEGTFAIYESPELFGARLLQDITTRPEFYYQEREIAKTEQNMLKFSNELLNVYEDIKFKTENDYWYSCERQCNARFRCEYSQVCSNNIEINPENIPTGFEFVEEKQ